MICSVTEGEDKPLKYPLMFRACEFVVINKIDLLPHLEFDVEKLIYNVGVVNPGAKHIQVSARTGEGVEAFSRVAGGRGAAGAGAGVTGGAGTAPAGAGARIDELLQLRTEANQRLLRRRGRAAGRAVPPDGGALRRAAGGCSALGSSPQARSDARHVAVEFVHPVIVGKRALPALGLTAEGGPLGRQLELAAEPQDIVMAFEAGEAAGGGARRGERGCLTVAFEPAAPEWAARCRPPMSRSVRAPGAGRDGLPPAVGAGARVLRAPRPAGGREARPVHDTGASSFLYPFLAESETDLRRPCWPTCARRC